jgi:NAD(P)-dependent dehydrogenase (short-subunit alcohol dehydrogenase family)
VTQTVAITGASAGIGRAAARQFARRGDRVALIARGHAGLEGAARDVQRAGGTPLAISADVADFAQVEAAAQQTEDTLGPIDVWVNVAFASVFSCPGTPSPCRRSTSRKWRPAGSYSPPAIRGASSTS